ncbi:undecaprenyl-phosphate alpha-N-acetylglucosaminyl 1-phosphate transferase [Proteobacteria bacterium 005FR1]|nr:undecaprenyl-phosphate alpha-N-acetylglucosaminyl 1-phosphate transferase [Proteobacteria bacterium 005FR1]
MSSQVLFFSVFSFIATFIAILVLSPLARRVGLVDSPDHRKKHTGSIPLVGGIAVFLPALVMFASGTLTDSNLAVFLVCAALLVVVGAIDDRFNLSYKFRIGVEMFAGAVMIFVAGLWIGNLGDLFGLGDIHLPFWTGVPFTLVAVFGIINAVNMMDGYDGIAAGVCLAAIATLEFLTTTSPTLTAMGPMLVGSLIAFLVCNLRAVEGFPKIFLGDAGSKFLGFALVWFLIEASRDGGRTEGGLEPVTALYLVGLPLIDMVTTTVRRMLKGKSPFHPDRTHIHHILQRAGFRKDHIIVLVLSFALAINLLGILLQILNTPDAIQFAVFIGLFLLYAFNVQHAWKLAKRLRKLRLIDEPEEELVGEP